MSKRVFVKTENYIKMAEMLSTLEAMEGNPERMGLGYGDPGLGKTTALEKLAKEFDAVFVRVLQSWSPASSVKAIAEAVGVSSRGNAVDVVNRIIDSLIEDPRPLLVDEIDRAIHHEKIGILENIRDIHDQAQIPVLFVGMGSCDTRLQRYKHLYDRITIKTNFVSTLKKDIEKFIDMCGIEDGDEFTPILVQENLRIYLSGKFKSVRNIKNILKLIEIWCDNNSVYEIDMKTYRAANIEKKKNDTV